jgi:hypothetical protein
VDILAESIPIGNSTMHDIVWSLNGNLSSIEIVEKIMNSVAIDHLINTFKSTDRNISLAVFAILIKMIDL